MSRAKTKKFLEFKTLDNTFDNQNLNKLKKKLVSYNKILLELAAGRGEYTLYLAQKNNKALCIAVDFRSNRLVWGAKKAKEQKLNNAVFLRERVENLINIFNLKKAAGIWIVFPDPFERKKQTKHRLTNLDFLAVYKKISQRGAKINFKTDNKALYYFTLDCLKQAKAKILVKSEDIFSDEILKNHPDYKEIIQETKYQNLAVKEGKKIYYLQFTLI
ncbi:MAG: tRNA (guanine-N(7)-)-methyltransferase [Patescibacteria group bacterium]|nr:MAG: tRNA (guanine-N(7)-)-methyltransferase [Patescibacteria group bacterium]